MEEKIKTSKMWLHYLEYPFTSGALGEWLRILLDKLLDVHLIFDLLFQHLALVRNVITQNAFYCQWKFKNYQHDIEFQYTI